MSDDLDRRLRRVESDVAEIKRALDDVRRREEDMMRSITRHVDLAVKAGIDSGLAPLTSIPARVQALESETAKQTPILQSTHEAVIRYGVIEENRDIEIKARDTKAEQTLKRWQVYAAIATPVLVAITAAILSHFK